MRYSLQSAIGSGSVAITWDSGQGGTVFDLELIRDGAVIHVNCRIYSWRGRR